MNASWTEYLHLHGATFEPTGVVRFSPAQEQAQQNQETTRLVPLSHLGLIQISGEDATSFLQNMTSNDVKSLAPGQTQHNSFNTAKGRMLASFLLARTEAGFNLFLSTEIKTEILKKLKMYVLRTKVSLVDAGEGHSLLGVAGPHTGALLSAAGYTPLPGPMSCTRHEALTIQALEPERFILICSAEHAPALWEKLLTAGAQAAGTDAWLGFDIKAGTPLITLATQDEFVAQMLNFELLGGVSFKKGCYPGQEIITRTQHIGKVKKRMYRAHVSDTAAPQAATDLYSAEFGTQSCGKIVMAAHAVQGGFEVLAVMQTSAQQAGGVRLGDPAGPTLEFLPLPYNPD